MMSILTMAVVTGGIAVLGMMFAAMILRLDAAVEHELNIAEQEQRWVSVI